MFQSIMKTSWGYIALGIMAPLAEEVVFRGGVLRVLLNATGSKSHWIAIILSALSSLVSSTSTWRRASTPSCPGFGTRMDVLSHQSDSTRAYVALDEQHSSLRDVPFNATDERRKLTDFFHGSERMMYGGLFFFALHTRPSIFQLALRMKKA